MKQILQSLNKGDTFLAEIPKPSIRKGEILVKSECSLISNGTEKMLLEFGKANFIEKVLQQPDKFRQVIEKMSTDGPIPTLESIKNKLNKPIPLGYSNVGSVVEIAKDITEFNIGDRVVTNGSHAEFVAVPKNLCAKIPDTVSNEEAVFTVLASIGLQGIRLAEPSFGETFLVSGLGIIGILTGQLLIAQGCKVIGIDPDKEKCKLAQSYGIEVINIASNISSLDIISKLTNSIGVDGALITASTKSSDPIAFAAKSCRKRGRIILVGVTGMNINRDLFYEKEIKFQVSCSYGPGRYDYDYEEKGHDYPIGFVRWTEKRNFEAILEALRIKSLKTESLISHKYPIEKATEIYELLRSEKYKLGLLIYYRNNALNKQSKTIEIKNNRKLKIVYLI